MSKRNLRKKPRISYYELEEPDLDEYVFCDECGDYVYEYCAIHGPLLVLPDDEVPSPTGFPDFVPHAALTIPHEFLHLAPSNIPGAGIGVFATLTLPKGVRFGPYRGVRTKDVDSEYCWQIYSSSSGGRKPLCAVDARDARRSNWMRYVNCSRHCAEQNLLAYQYQGELYYRTVRIVPRFSELLVFYGAEFARSLRVDLRLYNRVEGLQQLIVSSLGKEQKQTSKQPADEKPNNNILEKQPVVKELTLKNRDNSVEESASAVTELPNTSPITNDAAKWKPPQKKLKVNGTNHGKKETKKYFNEPERTVAKMEIKSSITTVTAPTLDSIQDKNCMFGCDLCSKKFTVKNSLIKHIRTHTGEKAYACNVCNKKFTLSSHLNNHLRIHTGEKLYACNVYNKKFTVSSSLNNHLRIHTDEKPYACDICDKRFNRSGHLNRHLRIHTGEKPYACNVCSKKFIESSALNNHLRTHTGEKPYACDICNKKFTVSSSLNNHLRTHTGEKPYACDICNKKFIRSSDLNKHLRIHTGEKPYACDTCDKRFNRSGNLNSHLRIHTGEKPYACNVCNKKFTVSSSLNNHLRTHTGEKPYACNVCNKKFTVSSSLNNHLRTHTGEKPYTCDICDKRFNQSGNLNSHVTIHTGEKPYACNVCNKKFTVSSSLNKHLRKALCL